jgi:hypothetical protein
MHIPYKEGESAGDAALRLRKQRQQLHKSKERLLCWSLEAPNLFLIKTADGRSLEVRYQERSNTFNVAATGDYVNPHTISTKSALELLDYAARLQEEYKETLREGWELMSYLNAYQVNSCNTPN